MAPRSDGEVRPTETGNLLESSPWQLAETEEVKKASAFSTTLNLTTAALGSGILSLPWTAAGASLVTAVTLTGLALVLNTWTSLILVEAAEKYQVFDLGSLLAKLPGRMGYASQAVNNIIIFVSQFMALVGFCIIVASSVRSVFKVSRVVCIAMFALVALPLSFASMRILAFSSSLTIAVNLYMFVYMGYLSLADPHFELPGSELCVLGITRGSVSMISAIIMGTILQVYVLPMYGELEDRSVAKFRRILITSLSFIFILYVGFMMLALVAFGRGVNSNVLKSMPKTTAADVTRFSMCLCMLGVYAVNVKPMVAMIHGRAAVLIATPCIVVASVLVAFFVTDLGVMNVLNGALSLGAFVTIGPALVGLYIMKLNRFAMVVLIVFGLVFTVLGFMLVSNYLHDLETECLVWRL